SPTTFRSDCSTPETRTLRQSALPRRRRARRRRRSGAGAALLAARGNRRARRHPLSSDPLRWREASDPAVRFGRIAPHDRAREAAGASKARGPRPGHAVSDGGHGAEQCALEAPALREAAARDRARELARARPGRDPLFALHDSDRVAYSPRPGFERDT